jgi:hypothetical protein
MHACAVFLFILALGSRQDWKLGFTDFFYPWFQDSSVKLFIVPGFKCETFLGSRIQA